MQNIDYEEQQALQQGQQHAQKIQTLRLQKETEFLKSLNRTFRIVDKRQVIVENILYDNHHLHIFIPLQYPFQQPTYATSDSLHQKHTVSQIIEEWVPKIRIFELIELIALRINQRHQLKLQVDKHFLLRGFHSPKATLLILVLAILLRVLIGLGSYSGAGVYPNLGDFQAHRNWMSVTVNRNIQNWYYQSQSQPWWRIDYPPVAAYLSYFFGFIYKNIEPEAMKIQKGYQSDSLKAYMRFTVLLVDIIFLFPPIVLLSQYFNKQLPQLLLLVLLLKPDVILIDHGHFQYNSLILGLILLAFYCLLTKRYYQACILYTIAIHAKQMAVYYSLAFLAALVGLAFQEYRFNKPKILVQIIKYATIVIIISIVIWAPWLGSLESIYSAISAIFPIQRGLYQLKVPNFWCITDTLLQWQSLFSKQTLVAFCFLSSLLFSVPSMISLMLNPTRNSLTIGFSTIALTFFMFSYHVHQKSILLPLLMMPFVAQVIGGWLAHELILAGCLGMFHLLKEDGQQLGYLCIMLLYLLFNSNYTKLKSNKPSAPESTVLIWHARLYQQKWPRYPFYAVLLSLHINEKFIEPPASLPYLHNLLFALFSFTLNLYYLLIGNALQLQWIYKWWQTKQKKSL